MPNARRLELTSRQQVSIVYALDGYAEGDALTLAEKAEIVELIQLIQGASALIIEYAKPLTPLSDTP